MAIFEATDSQTFISRKIREFSHFVVGAKIGGKIQIICGSHLSQTEVMITLIWNVN